MVFTKRKYGYIDLVGLLFKFAPTQAILRTILTIADGLLPAIAVLAAARFIDTAMLVAKSQIAFIQVLPYILWILGIMAFQRLNGLFYSYLDTVIENKLRLRCKAEIVERRAQLRYTYIEEQITRDLIERVCNDTDNKVMGMFTNSLDLIKMILQLGGYLGILLTYVWWAVIILLMFCIPLIILGYRAGVKNYGAQKETTKLDRSAKNYSTILTTRDNIDERYIFGYEEYINNKYFLAYEEARLHRKKVEKKTFISMKTGASLLILSTMAMSAPLIYAAINGQITIGMFSALIPALNQFSNMMSGQLTWNIRMLIENREYLRDLTEFMNLEIVEDAISQPKSPPISFESLEFVNVSFRYPKTENYILKNLSLKLEKGHHYAVVGMNGSGKTTITKLITGLYDEYEGIIYLNGRNLREYTLGEIKSMVCVVYQDFAHYNLSLGENIAIGDINLLEKERVSLLKQSMEHKNVKGFDSTLDFTNSGEKSQLSKKVHDAVKLLDLEETTEKLEDHYDAELGKIFGSGVDLSGGEWQRVALARAVISPTSLKILDEPTAALDPIGESNVYRQFGKISCQGTTIFISHRLGSTKLADTILVIDEGMVIERGTHEELMAIGGKYADMYRSQASWYTEIEPQEDIA